MKPKRVLTSLAELSPEVVEPEPDRPAHAGPKPSAAGAQQPRETQLSILVPEHAGFAGYQRWGLNE